MIVATEIPGLMNATEAAAYLGLSESLVRRYCRQKKLRARRFGMNWAIKKTDADHFKSQPRPVGNPQFRGKKKKSGRS